MEKEIFVKWFGYYSISSQIKEIVRYFSPKIWFNWFISFAIDIPVSFIPSLHKQTWRENIESPAVEVYHFREQYGYFASKSSMLFFLSIDH